MADEKSGETTDGVSVVVVDQPDRHKAYRSSEVTEVHRKRSKAPAVPLVAVTDVVPAQEKVSTTEKVSKHGKKDLKSSTPEKENEVVQSEKHHKHHDAKKSASCKSAPSGNLTIDNTKKKESVVMHSSATVPQPIPARLPEHTTTEEHKKEDQKDLIEEEPPSAPQEVKAASGKSQESNDDDEEAGGLPRDDSHASHESRASRVTRAVRHLLCCSIMYEAPSEECLPSQRDSAI